MGTKDFDDASASVDKARQMAGFQEAMSVALQEAGRAQDPATALTIVEDLLQRLDSAGSEEVLALKGHALLVKGACLCGLGRFEEAVSIYTTITDFCAPAGECLPPLAARAIFQKANAYRLALLAENEAAAYDELLSRFQDSPEPQLRAICAETLLNKGMMLVEQNLFDKALLAFDDLHKRYSGPDEKVGVHYHVITALKQRSALLNQLGLRNEAITACEVLIDLCEQRCPTGMMRTFLPEETWLFSRALNEARSMKSALRDPPAVSSSDH